VVVNNAGINRNCLAISISDEEWAEVLDTNLTGPFYVTRAFLTGMLANRFGRVINIGSVVSKGLAGQTHYAAAKAGLYGMTRTLAKEYGPKGITVNLITPGFFKTELTEETMSEAFNKYWHTYCPLRRVGELSEISKVVTFLASDGAGFINGAEIAVTGGLDDGA
jgi:3-oxoacyl-[acyl-carrier protein] reductase